MIVMIYIYSLSQITNNSILSCYFWKVKFIKKYMFDYISWLIKYSAIISIETKGMFIGTTPLGSLNQYYIN